MAVTFTANITVDSERVRDLVEDVKSLNTLAHRYDNELSKIGGYTGGSREFYILITGIKIHLEKMGLM